LFIVLVFTLALPIQFGVAADSAIAATSVVPPLATASEPASEAKETSSLAAGLSVTSNQSSWTAWSAEQLAAHIRSAPVEVALRKAVGDGMELNSLASEFEAEAIDGSALSVILADAAPCAQLAGLLANLKRGDCLKFVKAITESLAPYSDVKKKKLKYDTPWYWPYHNNFKNIFFWVLLIIVVTCFCGEKYLGMKQRGIRRAAAERREASKKDKKLKPEEKHVKGVADAPECPGAVQVESDEGNGNAETEMNEKDRPSGGRRRR